jgi:hypothetical protein
VSKLKTPREKKIASLLYDRRNVYGENDKASRKNIPAAKQRSHQTERRSADQPLQRLVGHIDEETAAQAELDSRDNAIKKKRQAFKKKPDAPLGDFIERQNYWAGRRESETDYWKARRAPEDGTASK